MPKVIIGPLGWTKEIWYKLDLSNIDYIVNFENLDISIEEYLEEVYRELKKYENLEIYTFSFGGPFILKIIEVYTDFHFNINKIFFLDALHKLTEISLSSIQENRKVKFNSEREIYLTYLEEEELSDKEKKDLIINQFIKNKNTYTHFMNNISFYKYLNIKLDDMFIFLHYDIKYEIYSSIDIVGIKYHKINNSDHLMMIEKNKLVQKIIDAS